MNLNPHGGSPFGRSPDGNWIVSTDELPHLSIPQRVHVTNEFIEIDGWLFPLPFVTKSFLVWLRESFLRWVNEDKSPRNREWVDGIAEALQDGMAGML